MPYETQAEVEFGAATGRASCQTFHKGKGCGQIFLIGHERVNVVRVIHGIVGYIGCGREGEEGRSSNR